MPTFKSHLKAKSAPKKKRKSVDLAALVKRFVADRAAREGRGKMAALKTLAAAPKPQTINVQVTVKQEERKGSPTLMDLSPSVNG